MVDMNDSKVTRLEMLRPNAYRTYFNNVRTICLGMNQLLAQIKRHPSETPMENLQRYYNVKVNRFLPLSEKLKGLVTAGLTVPKDVHKAMFGIERALNINIERLERQLGYRD